MKISRRKDREWVIDFTHEKKRVRRIIKGTRRMAEEAARHEKERITKEKYGLIKPKKKIWFEDYVKEYEKNHVKGTRSENTRKYNIQTLKAHFKGKFLSEITPGDIDRYQTKREKDGVSKTTIKLELSLLRAMFNRAIDSEDYGIEKNPVKKSIKKLSKIKSRRKRILTFDEVERLQKVADNPWSGHLPLFLLIAIHTGMRKMEILSLRWEHIDFKNKYLIVTEERSKNGRARNVPMNRVIFDALKELDKKHEFVFFSRKTGTHIKNIKTAFKMACEKAKIRDLTVHDLRHTAASILVNDCGMSLVTAGKILGHSSIEQTADYVHSREEHERQGIEQLGEILANSRKKVDKTVDFVDIPKPANRLYNYN